MVAYGSRGSLDCGLVPGLFARWRGLWKPKPEYQARRVIEHFDLGPVQTGNGGDQAEPEAISGAASALFQAIEALQHVFALLRGNPRPIVDNRKQNATIAACGLDDHAARLPPMFDRIIDEVGHCIEQKISVAPD
jgi:hypothetical protein